MLVIHLVEENLKTVGNFSSLKNKIFYSVCNLSEPYKRFCLFRTFDQKLIVLAYTYFVGHNSATPCSMYSHLIDVLAVVHQV